MTVLQLFGTSTYRTMKTIMEGIVRGIAGREPFFRRTALSPFVLRWA